ncbi:MAG: GTPase Era [Saezia sp.]
MNENVQMNEENASSEQQRCGLIAIVGRPNVGKSTLLNALVGQKISITSKKAQTTRHRIMGVRSLAQTQYIFIDTPGFQTQYTAALNKSLNKTVQGVMSDVSLILFVVEAGKFTLNDATVLSLLSQDVPVILVANKLDRIHRRTEMVPWLQGMQERYPFAEFIPMTARSPKDAERLLKILEPYLPQQEWWYEEEVLTDKSESFLVTETVREKLFRLTGDELPYTSAVVTEDFQEEETNGKRFIRVSVTIIVDRESHKAMVIGHHGDRLKRIGTSARHDLETLLDARVFLELFVKVRSGWADDDARVRAFGYQS